MPSIDLAKRRRVMQRSQKLGHCICDPRKPCPCDVFTNQGICPCAGERPSPVDVSQIRLTELVHNAGCASKIAPGDLEAVLARLPAVKDPAVLSGIACGDDAGIYRLADGTHLVQTVDMMTPCCDDPHTFGRICAANCLSDIYAMGGVPRTALSILAFPSETLPGEVMYRMLSGAMEVLAEAGCALIGGHSIKDAEIKLGFAVTGTMEGGKATAHDTAREGDLMVLTKPLGAGVLGFARQIGRRYGNFDAVVESMATLNRAAAEAAAACDVSACTDVTGFGLFGHLASMVRRSGVTAEVWSQALPAFEGALEALREGVVPGAIERNTEYVGQDIEMAASVEPAQAMLGFDAQTSGGLLLCIRAGQEGRLLEELARRGVRGWLIGKITKKSTGRIIVSSNQPEKVDKPNCCSQSATALKIDCCSNPPAKEAAPAECCAGASHATSFPSTAEAFAAMMKAASADGAVDGRTKVLINFALVVMGRCGPCFKAHIRKAQSMGITQEQLDEVAWCAVAMGGAPVRMFYLEQLAELKSKG